MSRPIVAVLRAIGSPCAESLAWARSLPKGTTLAAAYHACPDVGWLWWIATGLRIDARFGAARAEKAASPCSCSSCADSRASLRRPLPPGISQADAWRTVLPWPAISQALSRRSPALARLMRGGAA